MTVGIVIVSHSPKVAEGTADMVRQMVGTMVPLAWCGGDGQGGLGSEVGAILGAIEAAWSDDGVAVLVDLGGAAMQAEMAIELLDEERRARVQICAIWRRCGPWRSSSRHERNQSRGHARSPGCP